VGVGERERESGCGGVGVRVGVCVRERVNRMVINRGSCTE